MGDRIVRQCRRTWRRIGVPHAVAADMAAELAADLEAARRDRRDPRSYVGGDPAGFARAWASERGVVPVRPLLGRVAVAAVLGGLPGGFTGLFAAYGLSSEALASALGREELPEIGSWTFLACYVLSGVFAWAGMLAGASAVLRFHGDAARGETVRRLAYLLPVAGLATAFLTISAASALGFPFGLGYILAECLGSVGLLAASVVGIRWSVVGPLRDRHAEAGGEPVLG
ncbi:hypothetical protein ACFVH6_02435 [Spirillospora sp. NPDC127200]